MIWLLHGANTDQTQWQAIGVAAAADRLIADGEIPPVILVLPDGLDAMAAYDGDPPPFDTFLLDELRPRVDDDYRTLTDREHNAIGGISRGGEWALLVAGRHPGAFSAVGGHSPAIGGAASTNAVLVPLLAGADLRIRLDAGASDDVLPSTAGLDAGLTDAGVEHEFHSDPGGHDRAYWSAQVEDYLRWYAASW